METVDALSRANVSVESEEATLFYEKRLALPPELELMKAILEDAMHVLRRPHQKNIRDNVREARAWIDSDDEVGWPCYFRNVCAALGLSHTAVRKRVHEIYAEAWNSTQVFTRNGILVPPIDVEDGIVEALRTTNHPLQKVARRFNVSVSWVHSIGRSALGKEFIKRRRNMHLEQQPHPGENRDHCELCRQFHNRSRYQRRKAAALASESDT